MYMYTGGKKIANLTLHEASTDMVKWGKSFGKVSGLLYEEDAVNTYDADRVVYFSPPRGIEVDPLMPEEEVMALAIDQMMKAKADGYEEILVGGLTDLTYYQISAAYHLGLRVYVAITERHRDENDRFVFRFLGLRKVLKFDMGVIDALME